MRAASGKLAAFAFYGGLQDRRIDMTACSLVETAGSNTAISRLETLLGRCRDVGSVGYGLRPSSAKCAMDGFFHRTRRGQGTIVPWGRAYAARARSLAFQYFARLRRASCPPYGLFLTGKRKPEICEPSFQLGDGLAA